jgi:pSer/pThr/pTyr-binding forkhead associated (FHA) protein
MALFKKLFKRKDKNDEDILPSTTDTDNISDDLTQSANDDFKANDLDDGPLNLDDQNALGKVKILVNDEIINIYPIIPEEELRIGRDPSKANIVISELIVSKLHCTIYSENSSIFIKDHESTNGVHLDQEKISTYEIRDNDIITLGKKGTVKLIFSVKK